MEAGGEGAAAKDMVLRATEAAVRWAETRTSEGAEASLAATARLLAADPLNIDGIHLKGVALHLLGR